MPTLSTVEPFPFCVPEATAWDGTTYCKSNLDDNEYPSGSPTEIIPVFGPFTFFPVGFTLNELFEIIYRINSWTYSISWAQQSANAVFEDEEFVEWVIFTSNSGGGSAVLSNPNISSEADLTCETMFWGQLLRISDQTSHDTRIMSNLIDATTFIPRMVRDPTTNLYYPGFNYRDVGGVQRTTSYAFFDDRFSITFFKDSSGWTYTRKDNGENLSGPVSIGNYSLFGKSIPLIQPEISFESVNFVPGGTINSQSARQTSGSLSAVEYWPYDPEDGGGPIYNSGTGAQLRNPFTLQPV